MSNRNEKEKAKIINMKSNSTNTENKWKKLDKQKTENRKKKI